MHRFDREIQHLQKLSATEIHHLRSLNRTDNWTNSQNGDKWLTFSFMTCSHFRGGDVYTFWLKNGKFSQIHYDRGNYEGGKIWDNELKEIPQGGFYLFNDQTFLDECLELAQNADPILYKTMISQLKS
jgi:hypothetical protein